MLAGYVYEFGFNKSEKDQPATSNPTNIEEKPENVKVADPVDKQQASWEQERNESELKIADLQKENDSLTCFFDTDRQLHREL